MKKFAILLFLLLFPVIAQNSLHTPEKVYRFGKHVFELGFYDKAEIEFSRLAATPFFDDTAKFFIDLSRIKRGEYDIQFLSPFSTHLKYAIEKEKFESGKVGTTVKLPQSINDSSLSVNYLKLKILTDIQRAVFDEEDKNNIYLFGGEGSNFLLSNLEQRIDPKKKSPLFAGILSAIVPGLGRIYTGDYGEAAASLLLTGIFGYLAYSNFRDGYMQRGFIFGLITAFFQGGNIYGSVVSASLYNQNEIEKREKEFFDFYYGNKPLKPAEKILGGE